MRPDAAVVPLNGVTATSAVGIVGVVYGATAAGGVDYFSPGGLGSVGTVTVTGTGNVTLEGVQAEAVLSVLDSLSATTPQMTKFIAPLTAMQGQVGEAVAVVEIIHVTVAATGVQAAGQLGQHVVTGNVVSVTPVHVFGVEAYGRLGDTSHIQGVNVGVTGLEARMPHPEQPIVLRATFGQDLLDVQPSAWEPVKPA